MGDGNIKNKKGMRNIKTPHFFIDFSQFIAPNAYTNVLFMTFWNKM